MEKLRRMLPLTLYILAFPTLAAPIHGLNSQSRIPDDYIVVMHETGPYAAQASAAAMEWQQQYKVDIGVVYTSVLNGMNIRTDESTITAIAADPRVAYVEVNERFMIGEGETLQLADYSPDYTVPTSSWGLDRIDERQRPLDGDYTMMYNGTGVHAYVIDTGVNPFPAEFGDRVTGGISFINDGRGTGDCNSHGTFVAGILGGENWGVAKQVEIHPVRIAGCGESFERSKLLAAMDWVRNNHVKPAIANLSLGGRFFLGSLEEAANRLIDSGVVLIGGAGNNSALECSYLFPSTVGRTVIVGATAINDQKAGFSNYGECVDVYAPGQDVISINHLGQTVSGSDTSFAVPYVAGVAALYLDDTSLPSTPGDVSAYISATATRHVVGGVASGHSSNRLVYSLLDRPERLYIFGTHMPNNIRVTSEQCRGLNKVVWDAPRQGGPFTYELWLSAYPDFSSSYLAYTGTATSKLINIPVGTTRYVRVRATKGGSYTFSYYLTSDNPATSISGCY